MPTNNLPEIPEMSADRLTSQLYHLPAIIGRLGLSVANAQSALNADYTENVKELISIVKEIIPKTKPEARAEIESLIKQLAPSRYQFTETTLDFSADLSEAVDVAGSIGLGAGFGAVVINAGVSVGFARDYHEQSLEDLMGLLAEPSSERQFIMYEALRKGCDTQTMFETTHIKHWFIEQMRELVALEEQILEYKGQALPDELLQRVKPLALACDGSAIL